jgi:DNA-binding transcriptional LysR family regulator
MLPDLESLRCFAAAAKLLNFRRAARTVALSPAAFGERIKRLEDGLGAALFDRTTRRVTLTLAGERLMPQALACLEEARRCAEAVRGEGDRSPFDVTIGTRFELGMSWLTPALGKLEKSRPERHLHLYFGDTPALLEAMARGAIDGLVSSARLTNPGLELARLHEERYVFVASPDCVARQPLSRRDHARHHTLLELNPEQPLFRYFLDARPAGEDWTFRHVQYLGTIGPVRLRALEGAGVAVLPFYFVRPDLARRRLVRLLPRVPLPVDSFRLVWPLDHPRSASLRALAEELSRIPLR